MGELLGILSQSFDGFRAADEIDVMINRTIKNMGGVKPSDKYFWMKFTRTIRTTLDIIDMASGVTPQ